MKISASQFLDGAAAIAHVMMAPLMEDIATSRVRKDKDMVVFHVVPRLVPHAIRAFVHEDFRNSSTPKHCLLLRFSVVNEAPRAEVIRFGNSPASQKTEQGLRNICDAVQNSFQDVQIN